MADDLGDLLAYVLELKRDLDEHKVATRNMLRVGPVVDRDHAKGVRVEHGTDDTPDRSPWIQPAERSGVERDLPRNGQQVVTLSPYGDSEQGVVLPFGHSTDHANPATTADEAVLFNRDGVRLSVLNGVATLAAPSGFKVSIGGVTFDVTPDGVAMSGGKVTHDDKNIGSTHKHGGILRGGSQTDPPA